MASFVENREDSAGSDVLIVCGLGFGDEGKGTITDFLARTHAARAVVRFNGGPQSGHNVIEPGGRWHCFAQFGAGSFQPGTRTVLARGMVVELEALAAEAAVLRRKGVADALERLVIDPECSVVTPMHKMIGQMLEVARGRRALGSCGMGIGQALRDRARGDSLTVAAIRAGRPGLAHLARLAERAAARAAEIARAHPSAEMARVHRHFLDRCRPDLLHAVYAEVLERSGASVGPAVEPLRRALAGGGAVVFEGAQGALLDGRFGFVPHVTRSATTLHAAVVLAGASGAGAVRTTRIGVLRAYGHRHGPGPFPTEDRRLARRLADPRNLPNRWQGPFRVGWLDLVALRYGLRLNGGVDRLAVTGLDLLTGLPRIRICVSYAARTADPGDLDPHFVWDRAGPTRRRRRARARVLGFRDPVPAAPAAPTILEARTRTLFGCRPLDWVELPGWDRDLRGARSLRDLPGPARRFLDFLASEQGLGVPVAIVSVGPEATSKIADGW
jgi:adenylosuccinate synthase